MLDLSDILALPPLRWLLAVLKVSLILCLLWFVVHTGFLLWVGLHEELSNQTLKANVAIVLGNEILADGKPSPRLQARLDRAVELYKDARIESVVVSGGVDTEGHDEAVIMGRYLVKNGVPKEIIRVDSLGDDTYLSAANLKQMMEYYQSRRIVVVISSFHHILRTKLAMHKCGFKVVYGSYSRFFELRDLYYSIPKEFPAYYWYLYKPCPEPFRF